ncbi:MAG: hypothetical protein CMO01_24770 [Thalassobius sp.]|nr:hypothetical protein [Thalassovita sp.]
MKFKNITATTCLIALIASLVSGCYEKEELNVPVTETSELVDEIDIYIEENFTQKYDMAIRYKFVDNYVGVDERAVPPALENVQPMLEFIQEFWINPYLEVSNGADFFANHVPPEIVFLGGPIYNYDGTITLGTADAGAQITFTNVNDIDREDEEWVALQLHVVYHEFSHTVHQRYKLPNAFEEIAATGYTSGGSWYTLTDDEALERGFVSPYATSSPNEDFAETVSFYLYDKDFIDYFLTDEADCATLDCESKNDGREKIREKVASISEHYLKVTGIDLEELRNIIQAKL